MPTRTVHALSPRLCSFLTTTTRLRPLSAAAASFHMAYFRQQSRPPPSAAQRLPHQHFSSPAKLTTTTMHSASNDPIVETLKQFTTCDVSDALVKLKLPNGGFISGLTLWSPARQEGDTKIVGPAYTVKYVPLSDPADKVEGHYIDTVPPRSVLFVSCPPNIPNAVYGGLMSTRAQFLGAVGSIIDGRFRDVSEHRSLGYPVFARDTGTASPAGLLKVAGVNVPVQLQTDERTMTVRPGDYLIADLNGVVLLPRDLAGQALPLMRRLVEADEEMARAIGSEGMSFQEASKRYRSKV